MSFFTSGYIDFITHSPLIQKKNPNLKCKHSMGSNIKVKYFIQYMFSEFSISTYLITAAKPQDNKKKK